MISQWKKISIAMLVSGAGILVACNASDDPAPNQPVEKSMGTEVVDVDMGSAPAASQAESSKFKEPIVLAAVDQPIPDAKEEVEGLPEVSGLEDGKSAPEVAKDTSIKLKNPFTGDADKIEEGKKKWFSFGCSGCHGGGGGGGMCPSAINEKWVYGGNDDVLFRLITLGSDQLMAQGHVRVKKESVVAPMPQVGEMTDMTTEDVWLVLTYLRSKFKGRDEKIEW